MSATRKKRTDLTPPGVSGDERTTLLAFLDYLRDSVAGKVAGVPEPQVREPGVPSGTNLIGLVTHLTAVERFCFLGQEITDLDATMRADPDLSVDDALADYRRAVVEANEVIKRCTDLEQPSPRPRRRGSTATMRWTLVHMIEETGRHAGHADIIRERIDGAVGR